MISFSTRGDSNNNNNNNMNNVKDVFICFLKTKRIIYEQPRLEELLNGGDEWWVDFSIIYI